MGNEYWNEAVAMLCDWESNRRFGFALDVCHRLCKRLPRNLQLNRKAEFCVPRLPRTFRFRAPQCDLVEKSKKIRS